MVARRRRRRTSAVDRDNESPTAYSVLMPPVTPVGPRRARGSIALALTLIALAGLAGGSAPAHAARYCHGLSVGHTGNVYSVAGVSCARAKRIGLRFLHRRRVPSPWHCRGRRANSGRTKYVFTCRASRRRAIRVFDATFAD